MKKADQEGLSCGCAMLHENGASSPVFYEERGRCCPVNCPEGTRLRIRELRGGGRITSRLCSLGFTPGTVIIVCGSGRGSGCRIQVRDTCVALDERAAKCIVCDPVS